MGLNVPSHILESAEISADDLLLEIAVYLYDTERLSMGKARGLVQMDILSFQKELAKRNIYIKYDIDDLEEDIKTIESLNLNRTA
ncbi:MAG: UPF0175 family protein [Bacteroidota bacterium]